MTSPSIHPAFRSPPSKSGRPGTMRFLQGLVGLLDRGAPGLALLAAAVVTCMAILYQNAGIAVLFGILFLPGLLLFLRWSGRSDNAERLVFVIVFATASIVACATNAYYMHQSGTPYAYESSDDDYGFDCRALDIYPSNLLDFPTLRDDIAALGSGTWSRAYNYSIFLAFVYRGMDALGFEPHALYPRLVNALLLAALACMVHFMARRCNLCPWQSRLAAYLCGLSPLMVYVSAHTYRDLLPSLGIASALAALIELLTPPPMACAPSCHWRIRALLLLAFGLTLAGLLRETYLPMLVLISIVCVPLARVSKPWSMLAVGGLALLAGTVLLVIGTEFLTSSSDLEKLDYYHTRHADVTGNITGAVFRLPYLISLPARFVLRNVSPLPMSQGIATGNFWSLGTVLWFFGLPFLFRSVRAAFRADGWSHNGALRIVVFGFLTFYFLNIATSLQDRHIVNYIPAASVVTICGLAQNPRSIQKPLIIMLALASLLLLAFLTVKAFF